MTFLMEASELLSSLVELDLRCLRLGNFVLQFLGLARHFNGQFLDLKCQLLNLGLIGAAILFKGEVVLLFLASRQRPLLEFFLVPVHLQFELIHAFVGLEDHILDVVQPVLLVGNARLKFLDLILEAAGLTLSDLFHMLFGFNFLILSIDQALSVNELHLNGFQVLLENLQAFLVLFNL